MNNLTATAIAEGWQEAEDDEEYLAAWQHLIDTGLAWQLQGHFGRTALNFIEAGHCTPPDTRMRDDVAH